MDASRLTLERDEPRDDVGLVRGDHDRQLALGDLLPPSSLVGRLTLEQLSEGRDLSRDRRLGSVCVADREVDGGDLLEDRSGRERGGRSRREGKPDTVDELSGGSGDGLGDSKLGGEAGAVTGNRKSVGFNG